MKHNLIKFILLLASSFSAIQSAGAQNETVARGQAPNWHSGSPTTELTSLCSSEKDPRKKLSVCSAAVARYSDSPLTSLPTDAKSQALYLIEMHESHPKDDLYIFGLHDSHITLGRLSLKEGDLKKAKKD